MTDPCPNSPEWPCEFPDFEVLGSLDALALDAGGDIDDGDALTYGYPPSPGFTVGYETPAAPATES